MIKCRDCIAYPVCSPNIGKDGPECQKVQYSLKEMRSRIAIIRELEEEAEELKELLIGRDESTGGDYSKEPRFDGFSDHVEATRPEAFRKGGIIGGDCGELVDQSLLFRNPLSKIKNLPNAKSVEMPVQKRLFADQEEVDKLTEICRRWKHGRPD